MHLTILKLQGWNAHRSIIYKPHWEKSKKETYRNCASKEEVRTQIVRHNPLLEHLKYDVITSE